MAVPLKWHSRSVLLSFHWMILPILGLGAVSFVISWILTYLTMGIAPKLGFVDKPGGHKVHANPKPLGGGIAIFLGFVLPLVAVLLIVNLTKAPALYRSNTISDELQIALKSGAVRQTRLALTFLGT